MRNADEMASRNAKIGVVEEKLFENNVKVDDAEIELEGRSLNR